MHALSGVKAVATPIGEPTWPPCVAEMALTLGSTSRMVPPPVTRQPPIGTGHVAVALAVIGWLVQAAVQLTTTLSQESAVRFSASPLSVTGVPPAGRSNGCGVIATVS